MGNLFHNKNTVQSHLLSSSVQLAKSREKKKKIKNKLSTVSLNIVLQLTNLYISIFSISLVKVCLVWYV